MKTTFNEQTQLNHNRIEEGDTIGLVVSDEDAIKILDGTYDDKFIRPKVDWKVGDKFDDGDIVTKEWVEAITRLRIEWDKVKVKGEEEHPFKEYALLESLKAPIKWHLNNFILGKDVPSWKQISSTRMVENKITSEMDEVKAVVGNRGAVAAGKRQEDGSIKWYWNYQEKDTRESNLLDFYMIPDVTSGNRDAFTDYTPKYQSFDALPRSENENPLLAWKAEIEPTPAEWQTLTDKAVISMREAEVDESIITNFINKR